MILLHYNPIHLMKGHIMWSKELKEAIDKGFEDNYCFVAFVDILGFREHVKKFINPKQEADEQILENIKSALEDALKLTNR